MPANLANKDEKIVFACLANPNGWSNPDIIGGGEKIGLTFLSSYPEYKVFMVIHESLQNESKSYFPDSNSVGIIQLPLKKFSNFIVNVIKFLVWYLKVFKEIIKNRSMIELFYSPTNNLSDLLPLFIAAKLFHKPIYVKCQISIYEGQGSLFADIQNNLKEESFFGVSNYIKAIPAYFTLLLIQRCDKISCLTKVIADSLVNHGVIKNKIVVEYPDVVVNLRKNFKPKKIYDLCFMSRVEKYKGIFDFIELYEQLLITKPNLTAIVIGDGSALSVAKSHVKNKSLDNIKFLGYMGDTRFEYLANSRILILPTRAKEGYGLVIGESIKCKTQVVTYDNPVFREVYGDSNLVIFANNLKEVTAITTKMLTKSP